MFGPLLFGTSGDPFGDTVTWRQVHKQSQSLNQLNQWITFGSEIYDLSGTRMTLQAQLRI